MKTIVKGGLLLMLLGLFIVIAENLENCNIEPDIDIIKNSREYQSCEEIIPYKSKVCRTLVYYSTREGK